MRRRAVWAGLALGVMTLGPVWAGAQQEAAEAEQSHLLGSCGLACGWMCRDGLTVGVQEQAEVFSLVAGGLRQHNATALLGDLRVDLLLDTEQAGGWRGGQFRLLGENIHGHGLTAGRVGDVMYYSNNEAPTLTQVTQLYYRHDFGVHNAWLKAGLQDTNDDFAYPSFGVELMHSAAGLLPNVPLTTYSATNWGLTGSIQPGKRLSFTAGVHHSKPDGALLLFEPAWLYTSSGRPGSLKLGGWYDSNRWAPLTGGGTVRGNHGMYLIWDHPLFTPREHDPSGTRGLGLFAEYGWAPRDRNAIEHAWGTGLSWTGALRARPHDVLGLGLYQARFAPAAGTARRAETAVELMYKAVLTGWFTMRFDLQTIQTPGGNGVPDAWLLGLRTETSL